MDKIGGNFSFADPELKILVKNKGIGVAANVQMDFWVKDGLGANRFNGGLLEFPTNRELTEKRGQWCIAEMNWLHFIAASFRIGVL